MSGVKKRTSRVFGRMKLGWEFPLLVKFLLVLWAVTISCEEEKDTFIGSAEDDALFASTGAWENDIGKPVLIRYVRPPGVQYGTGDGSSWDNAFSGLPTPRVRGTMYYFSAGEFHHGVDRVETYILDDPEDGQYIWLVKATESDHGTDDGFETELVAGPAQLGPISFVTGQYVVNGNSGYGFDNYGFEISHRDCPLRETDFIASPIFFPWNSVSRNLLISHIDIRDCGTQADQTIRSQDAVYAVAAVSNIIFRSNYIHDAWRNNMFLQGAMDVLLEENHFARAGLHHEAGTMAFRDSRNIVVRRNYMVDSLNRYISLQNVRNVLICANILTREQDGWSNWAAIFSSLPAKNVLISNNTFYNLAGLNVGVRVAEQVSDFRVFNNLWASSQANQIMLMGEHSHNGFWQNYRVDGNEPVLLDNAIEETDIHVFESNPFVNTAAQDFRLTAHTPPGLSIFHPMAMIDFDGIPFEESPDRGAFQYVQ